MSMLYEAPKPNLDAVPEQLKSLPNWRPWRFSAPQKAEDKPKKTPLCAHTLKISNNTGNTDDCTTFENLKEMLFLEQKKPYNEQRFHGVGISLTGANNLLVVDIDKAINADGSIKPYALEVLTNIEGFVERSVSGKGFHIFTTASDWDIGNTSDNNLGLEVFRSGRYIAITGEEDFAFSKPIPSKPISTEVLKGYFAHPKQINSAKLDLEHYKKPDESWTVERVKSELLDKLTSDLIYPEWIDVGMCLHHQFEGSQEAYEAFDDWSAKSNLYPSGNEPSTWDKWQSFGNNPKRNLKSIGTLIKMKTDNEALNTYKSSDSSPLLMPLKEARFTTKKIDWLVEGVIKQGSLVMLGGAPSGGKTYVAIELMMSVATGKQFFEAFPTKQGDVVFIACEGRDSIIRRATAWQNLKNDGVDVENVFISRQEMVVCGPEIAEISSESMAKFIQKSKIIPKVVFIDTMNYSLGEAKENDANDMTEYFRKIANNLIRKFGCTVVLVHHTSKNGDDIRGSSSIRGALDSLFFVSQSKTGQFKVENDKHKDREKMAPFYLNPKSVQFNLADGSIESNIALFMSDERDSPSGITLIQQKAISLLEGRVGMNGVLSKKEVLDGVGFTDTKNASRDIFKPLQEAGYITAHQKQVTLIKPLECNDFET
jgi:archaellum biogenesis ATPase FlaH